MYGVWSETLNKVPYNYRHPEISLTLINVCTCTCIQLLVCILQTLAPLSSHSPNSPTVHKAGNILWQVDTLTLMNSTAEITIPSFLSVDLENGAD